ncbi:ParB/RepB/Spo0J family partition protein [Calycomorphotria hydatis]|uniref:Putative chromosome-partitioning protein ParB n=1 Tax=Calycomorphotria hydatis TaxID=2528027 RepID=A0A517T448_9PLAN|nr:ParB/RepB/Spo0J family partition protein [Calycomorphotria hydatis]QDT63131.1 putative chromosome-partitioning protein ParB [Calycomorphotria hydatis]
MEAQFAQQDDSLTPMRRLGRGLSALLGSEAEAADAEGQTPGIAPPEADASHISVEMIVANPFQPRKEFGEEEIAELCTSITRHGILQPLLVRPADGQYQLIAGERRLRAARKAGLETVPCRVMEIEDRLVYEVAIEENLKRKDLNVLEKAQAFKDYIDRFSSSIEELARNLGMNRSTVSNYIRLLDLSDKVKDALQKDKLTNGHARALVSLDHKDQNALCKEIVKDGLSVRATEKAVRALRGNDDSNEESSQQENADVIPMTKEQKEISEPVVDEAVTNHVLSIAEELRAHFGTGVAINLGGKDSGKFVIDFSSNEEFERILEMLRNSPVAEGWTPAEEQLTESLPFPEPEAVQHDQHVLDYYAQQLEQEDQQQGEDQMHNEHQEHHHEEQHHHDDHQHHDGGHHDGGHQEHHDQGWGHAA